MLLAEQHLANEYKSRGPANIYENIKYTVKAESYRSSPHYTFFHCLLIILRSETLAMRIRNYNQSIQQHA